MRTLITVSAIFLILCIVMVFNYRYINETADELVYLVGSLSLENPLCNQTINKI